MKKILLVGELDQILGSLNHHLAEKFQTQMCTTDLELVKAMMKVFKADMAVVCLNENGDSPEAVLDFLQERFSQMPVLHCAKGMWLSTWKRRMVFWEDRDLAKIPAEEAPAGNGALEEAMDSLPMKQRQVIHLFYYEEMSVEEIGEALDEKPSTIRSQLSRARKALKKKLTGEEAKRHVQG